MPETEKSLTSFQTEFPAYAAHFQEKLRGVWDPRRNRDIPRWQSAYEGLPELLPSAIDLNASAIRIGAAEDLKDCSVEVLGENLREFHPWRKGPFELFGIKIETEWRSDLKWDRLKDKIEPLTGRKVLDLGCGSGYHCWRMLGAGARFVLGIEPALVYAMQFKVMQKYIQAAGIEVLPLGVQDLPASMPEFDTVFSMGLLYHRRDPMEHLAQLRSLLVPGGELVLETLVIEGAEGELLQPKGRYAQMRNVWSLPSVQTAQRWLGDCGFANLRCVDVSQTTSAEQRTTDWMRFQSLQDFLEPNNPNLTIEGYPAPMRAIFTANRP